MTYRIKIESVYHDAFDKSSFPEFIANEFPYDIYGVIFPELTEEEFEAIKTEMIARYDNPFGDLQNIPGYVNSSRTETPEKNTIIIDFESKEAYDAFLDSHLVDNRSGGVMLAATHACENDYRNDELVNRRVKSVADADLAEGSLLMLGRFIIKKWQIIRQSVQTVTHETIA